MYRLALALFSYAPAHCRLMWEGDWIEFGKNASGLQVFPAKGQLESVFVDVLNGLSRKKRRNQCYLVITDKITKFTSTLLMKAIFAGETAPLPMLARLWHSEKLAHQRGGKADSQVL